MVKSLDRKWKEFLFAFSGFGPNLLMVLMGAYFTDAINPAALTPGSHMAITDACLILPAVFPVLYAISKAFDGIIDIPFAHITDTLSTKWGRRRPAILVCAIPMIASYAMLWLPIFKSQLGNTIWIICWSLVFFATYTMCLIAFYGSLSTTCSDEPQRLRVSGYKAFFDTISYCLVYALVPVILDGANINIDKFALICLPLMLTISIPLFLIKEGEKYGYPENLGMSPEKISIWQSLKLTFTNRIFLNWTIVNCCTYFGLQMFLVGMNAMIIGGMGLSGLQMTLANTCAFAPVPIMLYLFNKLKAKKGVRFTYQTCLISFAISILSFFIGSSFIWGDNALPKVIIACVGGIFGSWAIGAFFMMPYLAPAQISAVEEKLTGKNHSAMYFAGNAVSTSVIGAISGSIVYENIKNLFISKEASGVVWATGIMDGANSVPAIEIAADKFGLASSDSVFNLGTLIVPFIVCTVCILGAILCFRLPKDFTPTIIAKELKKMNPELDISSISDEEVKEEKGEIVFVQIGLSILSGFIFGFIWSAFLLKSVKELTGKGKNTLFWALSCFVPFFSAYTVIRTHNALREEQLRRGMKPAGKAVGIVMAALCCILPILPINVAALAYLQHNVNRIYKDDAAKEAAETTDAVIA